MRDQVWRSYRDQELHLICRDPPRILFNEAGLRGDLRPCVEVELEAVSRFTRCHVPGVHPAQVGNAGGQLKGSIRVG